MVSVTVCVPEELREKMRMLKGVNWFEVIRRAIEQETRKAKMREASKRIDKLREKHKIKWESKVIRECREHRR
ncbi:MAG: hypothetical protein QXU32_12780 [Nitrososphaerales archaeon]